VELNFRYIGEALRVWQNKGSAPTQTAIRFDPVHIHPGDWLTHPDFPAAVLVVRFREIDIAAPRVTLYLDLLHDNQQPTHLRRPPQ
jgi:hypothetical protein